jgi:hypothetical protein
MRVEDVFGLIEFSSRLLMGWIGVAAATAAAHVSTDLSLLFGLASRRTMFDGTEEEGEWKAETMRTVARSIAKVMEEATSSPYFPRECADLLDDIVDEAEAGSWSEEIELVIPVSDGYHETRGKTKTNSHGFYLEGAAKQDKTVSLYVHTAEDTDSFSRDDLLRMGQTRIALVNDKIIAKSTQGEEEDDVRSSADTAVSQCGTGWFDYFYDLDSDKFLHEDPRGEFRFACTTQKSKLHRQCIAPLNPTILNDKNPIEYFDYDIPENSKYM